jgi:hypothetical protein
LEEDDNMWSFADRLARAVSDVTIGTVIVLVHVALADRLRRQERRLEPVEISVRATGSGARGSDSIHE